MMNTFPIQATAMQPLTIHPVWLRAAHWLNAIAVVVMVSSAMVRGR